MKEEEFRVHVQDEYILDNAGMKLNKKIIVTLTNVWLGDLEAQNIQKIFFCNSEQIWLAQRFVSSFIYKTDATFNINKLKIPLSVLIKILNIGKPFSFALYFITLKSTTTFEFMKDQLDEIFFLQL